MRDLLQSAFEIVNKAMEGKKNPVIMFSGGKDSVVMLHILRYLFRRTYDVLFHREPWMLHKYAFGEALLRSWGCTAYDYPPSATSLWMGKGIVAFTNYYQIGVMPDGRPATLALPKNIVEPIENEPFLCGLADIINRPKATFQYPWDVVFIGHKSSDEDQIAGKVPLHADIVDNEAGPRLAFPLREWSDDDIWQHTWDHDLPYQEDRYEFKGAPNKMIGEIEDKTNNSDYFHTCIRCIDRRNTEPNVPCPLIGNKTVPNRSADVPYQDIQLSYFGET